MRDGLHVVVPVAVVHVRHETARSQRQVIGILLDGTVIRQTLDEDDLRSIGRKAEAFDVNRGMADLLTVRAVGIDGVELSATEEGNLATAINPSRISLTLSDGGQLLFVLAVGIHDVENLVALVLLHAVIADLISDLLAVGRRGITAHATHGPQGFRGHQVRVETDVVTLNHCLCADVSTAKDDGGAETSKCLVNVHIIYTCNLEVMTEDNAEAAPLLSSRLPESSRAASP